MESKVNTNKENGSLDIVKFYASLLVTAAHLPSVFSSEAATVYFFQWYLRFCVPFFFICSGYYFAKTKNKTGSIRRIAWLFGLSYTLYLPVILSGVQGIGGVISKLRWELVIGHEHLWYLSAALEGMVIWYLLEKLPVISGLFRKLCIPVSVLLLLLGGVLDEHYRLMGPGLLRSVGDFLAVFGGPRNVVFMGFPLLILGGGIAWYEERLRRLPTWLLVSMLLVLRLLALGECAWLYHHLGASIINNISIFNCWPAPILFLLCLRFPLKMPDALGKQLRRLSEYIYILHPLIARYLMAFLPMPPLALLAATIAMCIAVCMLLEKQFVRNKK